MGSTFSLLNLLWQQFEGTATDSKTGLINTWVWLLRNSDCAHKWQKLELGGGCAANANHTPVSHKAVHRAVKGEIKQAHLRWGVLKCSWEAIQEEGISSPGGAMNSWTWMGPNHKYSKDSVGTPAMSYSSRLLLSDNPNNQLHLAKNSFLATSTHQSLCQQLIQAFPVVFKKPWLLLPNGTLFGLLPKSVYPKLQFFDPK